MFAKLTEPWKRSLICSRWIRGLLIVSIVGVINLCYCGPSYAQFFPGFPYNYPAPTSLDYVMKPEPEAEIDIDDDISIWESNNVGYIVCPGGFTTKVNDEQYDLLVSQGNPADCDADNKICNRCVGVQGEIDSDWPHSSQCTDPANQFYPLKSHLDLKTSGGCSQSYSDLLVTDAVPIVQPPIGGPLSFDYVAALSNTVGYFDCPPGFTTDYNTAKKFDLLTPANCDEKTGRCNRCIASADSVPDYDQKAWPHNHDCEPWEFEPRIGWMKRSELKPTGGCGTKINDAWIVDAIPSDFWEYDRGNYGYQRISIDWQGHQYQYYRTNWNQFSYLPDEFKLAEQQNGAPALSILQFVSSDGSVENTEAIFRFFAEAVFDRDRIDAAQEEIESRRDEFFIREEDPIELVVLQGYQSVATELYLRLPNEESNEPLIRENARIDLKEGVQDELDLSFSEFRALWDAIFSTEPGNNIFTGFVYVSINDGQSSEMIDMNGRLDPIDMDEYYDSIIDPGTDTTYSKTLEAITFPPIFDPPDNGDERVQALALDFGQNSAGLSPANLQREIDVQRPIRDIVLGNEDSGIYPYTLRVVRLNNRNCCSTSADAEAIYVTQSDVNNCQAQCS